MKIFYLKLMSYASTVIAPIVLFFIVLFPNIWMFVGAIIVWFGYFAYIFFAYKRDINQVALHMMTALSLLILLVLTESAWLRWFFVIASACLFFFIAFWSEPRIDHAIHIKEKPLRRMMMMLYVFNVYACLVGLFAIYLYFPLVSFWWLSLLGSMYAGLGAYMIWHLYYKKNIKELILWSGVVTFIILEFMWVMTLLPFGYLALGFLVAWLWYIIQLFIRFHLSMKGIIWRRQIQFVIGNVILFVGVLYIMRWI